MSDPARYELHDGIATITLDDGKVNALSPAMVETLMAALERAESEAKAVVLVGRENRFCAGFDLRVLATGRDAAEPLVRAGAAMFMRVYGFPLPVVTACTGHALAGGALLLLTCDARIAPRGDFKIGLNEVGIGIPLPMLVQRLVHDRIDVRHQVEAGLLATIYDPAGAQRVGFVDEVVEPADVVAHAHARAKQLTALPRRAFARSKAAMRQESIALIEGALTEDLEKILGVGTG